MALTEEQRAKLNAKAQQKKNDGVDYDEYQEFLEFKKMKQAQNVKKEQLANLDLTEANSDKRNKKKPRTYGIWIMLVVLVGGGIFYFYFWPAIEYSIARAKYHPTPAMSNTSSSQLLVEVDKPSLSVDSYGLTSIKGSLKNVSGSSFSYVQVTLALYDKDGAQVGTAMDNINHLAKDAVWKYSALPMVVDVEWETFEVVEVKAW